MPIGMNKFCLFPTVNGDWVTFIGEVLWLIGDENDGVADLELLNDTVKRIHVRISRTNYQKVC